MSLMLAVFVFDEPLHCLAMVLARVCLAADGQDSLLGCDQGSLDLHCYPVLYHTAQQKVSA